ncbi:class I SAM-dependent methyltransferase [Calothrix sp. 336/3]|uniref:class I SAM-dependent methyltransferase n=1 Tax=Calothrix sp. 336/3 TaxID=1337936 RepID=UPI0004E3F623|nr:methyltransferase domain-containing protein [Calothrix sp. 336/3]AKG22935.1 methyltransferase type 11 [Calothrix sp. 336/3]
MTRILRTRKTANNTTFWAILLILTALIGILFYNTPWGYQWRGKSGQWIEVSSKASLVHVGSHDSFASSQEGIRAGRFVLDFLETKNQQSGKEAIKIYNKLIPIENYGGEYTALQWFCQYLLATDNQKKQFLSDKYAANFYEFFAENDFARLKEYLKRKYKFETYPDQGTTAGENRKAFLEDNILFNNPRREEWEKTSKIISAIKIQPGQHIADVGSGPGYYTLKFSQLVGDKGYVYAIDTVKEHLEQLQKTSKKFGIKNIETIQTTGTTIGVKANKVDVVFLCSLYHNLYAFSREEEIASFVGSIKSAIKKGGRLIVVDNALVNDSELPYHGPYIAKELIIAQMKYYGFQFEKDYAFIPQRYLLIFKKV